ncbi:MAG: adventurous gliding motility protein CglF [Deltaproteobacteria bacterium]|nr:adventurous gliding motility protein CglF [Deltaproteobacteria bacterium]
MRARVLAVVAVLALAMPAFGQDGKDVVSEGGVSYNRKTVINFEDDTIEGDLKTPDAVYLEARKKMRHRSLIRIRTDFRREVLGSIANL